MASLLNLLIIQHETVFLCNHSTSYRCVKLLSVKGRALAVKDLETHSQLLAVVWEVGESD